MTEQKDRIEKIILILKEVYWNEFDYSHPDWKEQGEKWFAQKTNQILALFDEEAIRREERERIFKKVEEHFMKSGFKSEEEYYWWQTLKSNKEE